MISKTIKSNMKKYFLAFATIFLLLGCKESKKNSHPSSSKENQETIDMHTSELSLDWDGTYQGFLPCDNCSGVLSTVILNNDKTFEKYDLYLETKEGSFSDKGNFYFTNNGSKIVLNSEKGKITYAVQEKKLILLKNNKDKPLSNSSKKYTLNKLSDKNIDFSNEPIKGLFTYGHEVSTFEPFGSSKSYWLNDPNGELKDLYYKNVGKLLTPYIPVIVEIIVENKGKATDGFPEQYESVLELIEIKYVKPLTYENYYQN